MNKDKILLNIIRRKKELGLSTNNLIENIIINEIILVLEQDAIITIKK